MVVPERRRPGYYFDESEQRFVKKLGTPGRPAGSGYSMMQLTWPGEAFVLEEDNSEAGQVKPIALQGSVLDFLSQRGVTWLLTRRLCDLSLYNPQSVIDVESLAYAMFLHESQGSNMMVQVDVITSIRSSMGMEG